MRRKKTSKMGEFLQQAGADHGIRPCRMGDGSVQIKMDSRMGTCISRGQAKNQGTIRQTAAKGHLQLLRTYAQSRQEIQLLQTFPCQKSKFQTDITFAVILIIYQNFKSMCVTFTCTRVCVSGY